MEQIPANLGLYYITLLISCFVVVVLLSLFIGNNYMEHIEIGLEKVPLFLHVPFQIIIPFFNWLLLLCEKKYSRS